MNKKVCKYIQNTVLFPLKWIFILIGVVFSPIIIFVTWFLLNMLEMCDDNYKYTTLKELILDYPGLIKGFI